MNTRIVSEGRTKILVPGARGDNELPSTPVFYNPLMQLNRDINVAAIATFAGVENFTYADALSASGIRGVRIAKEIGGEVTLCDWKQEAVRLIEENIGLNRLSNCTTVHADANVLLSMQRFDIVDLDPFGTPTPFLDAAGRSAKKLLAVTATDTAPLCGAHLKSALRTYSARPLNNEYHRETGLRVLIGAIVCCLAKYDKAATPLLSYAHRHYARVYVGVKKSVKGADTTMKQMGFVAHCDYCNNRYPAHGLTPIACSCAECGAKIRLSGPLWLGALHEKDFVEGAAVEAEHRGFDEAAKLLHTCAEELNIPIYYDYHKTCQHLHISAPPITSVIRTLQEQGFKASRTHLCGTGIKTDASAKDLEEALHALSERQ